MDKIILIIQIRFLKITHSFLFTFFTFLPLHAFHARGRSQRGQRRSDDACQHLEGQPPYLLVLHRLPPFFSNVPLIVFFSPADCFFSPAEIKEIAEILAAHDILNDILRRRHFLYFFYFCGTINNHFLARGLE